LNWLIHFNGEVVVTIPGATKAQQAAENAGAMQFRLADSDLASLDDLSRSFREKGGTFQPQPKLS